MSINSAIRKLVHIQRMLPITIVISILSAGVSTAATAEENELALRIEKNTYSLASSEAISKNIPDDLMDQRTEKIAEGLKKSIAAVRTKKNGTRQAPGNPSALTSKINRLRTHFGDDRKIRRNAKTGTPRQIKGRMLQEAVKGTASPEEQDKKTARAFLRSNRQVLRLRNPDREFKLSRMDKDHLNRRHLRFTQTFQNLPVWPAEIIVHLNSEGNVDLMSGAYIPTPRKLTTQAIIEKDAAIILGRGVVPGGEKGKILKPELIVYAPTGRMARLAWKFELEVNLLSRWLVIIDALNGKTLDAYNQVMDANVVGSGIDLFGISRTLNVWEKGGTFSMVDTSKQMFDPANSNPPDTASGGIVILDMQNKDLESNPPLSVVSSLSATSWALPDAVSASFGLSETYDYYLDRHQRDSLDGQGGTIVAIVRVGLNFNNAFWNGSAMFFGDALPYAGALDVVAHELTHGVTTSTANLVYRDQPGAINEAFSDIFGEMVEARTKGTPDWLKGGTDLGFTAQNYANPSAVICIANIPCPAKMSEFISTQADNGGVHINSSIINHAFYLLAEGSPGAIGTLDGAAIFYRTLTTKLAQQSQFIDVRLGAIASAEELFGVGSTQSQKTAQAFDAVEIFDAPETPEPIPLPTVNGDDATLFVGFNPAVGTNGAHFLSRREEALGDPQIGAFISHFDVTRARPAVTGDGELAVFVDSISDICFIATGAPVAESCLKSQERFHSVAMSPDGNQVAFVPLDATGKSEKVIVIVDLVSEPPTSKTIPLQAPLIDGGTIDVLRADVMDFSADGNILLYDALNALHFSDGTQLGLWSIYALDLERDMVLTIVPPTPDLDLGNPSFAQTNDNLITFETIDTQTGNASIMAGNLFSGRVSTVATAAISNFEAAPGFTGDDNAIIFGAPSPSPTGKSLFRQALSVEDGITPTGSPTLWLDDAVFGVIYRRGAFTAPTPLQLSVSKTGNGTGLVTSVPSGIICGSHCAEPFPTDTVVTLTPVPEAGSTFVGWGGDPDCGDGIVTMTAEMACTAEFSLEAVPVTVNLTVSKTGNGTGLVTSVPSGIICGSDCAEPFLTDTVVTLTPVPETGSIFVGWGGNPDCSNGNVTMTADKTCSAEFSIEPVPVTVNLTVLKTGNGTGLVTSVPSGIICGSHCAEPFLTDTVVTLTPVPETGSIFVGWGGNPDCSNGNVSMTADMTCSAEFSLEMTPPVSPPGNEPLGDLFPRGNPDGQVTRMDAELALKMAIGLMIPTQQELLAGDVGPLRQLGSANELDNGGSVIPEKDGVMNIADAIVLLEKAEGLISLPAK